MNHKFGERMDLSHYLASHGLAQNVIDELLPFVPAVMPERSCGTFYDAASIMNPDRWFAWPGQTRFVAVGQCVNGDGIAVDTEKEPGAVFYVAHELLGNDRPLDEMVIRVAGSPSDYVQKLLEGDFPFDYWEARARNTEPGASPSRRSGRGQAVRAPRRDGGR
jgi:hypothetical protein